MAAREQVGFVYVDAGIIMLGDPCYTLPDDASHRGEVGRNWDAFCEATFATEDPGQVYKPFGDGTAVVVSSGYGDGQYPVYVTRSDDGRVASVTVKFI